MTGGFMARWRACFTGILVTTEQARPDLDMVVADERGTMLLLICLCPTPRSRSDEVSGPWRARHSIEVRGEGCVGQVW